MGKMFADIKRIVNEDISNRVNQYDVLYEAITNSIQANSTSIKCILETDDQLTITDDDLYHSPKLNSIKIIDNGDGINDLNFDSFSKYRTDFKKNLGCKGVGRFVYLKVYKRARYISYIKKDSKSRDFNFDFNFDPEKVGFKECKVSNNYTELHFNNLNETYFNDGSIDRRINIDLNKIKSKVLNNILPILYFNKKNKKIIQIEFIYGSEIVIINNDDIPNFEIQEFDIINKFGERINFVINYHISNNSSNFIGFYCANKRTVCSFEDKDLKLHVPDGYSVSILIESKYLDLKVNNNRNDFDIFPVKVDQFSSVSWEMINSNIKINLTTLVKERIPELKKLNTRKLKEIQEERPYLLNYIDNDDVEMAGFVDKKTIIEKAKRKFDTAKENIFLNSNKNTFTNKELSDAIILAQNELVSYINDRVLIIEKLRNLSVKKERVENIIHDLFMVRKTKTEYNNIANNGY